jgi:hypothetical protein
MIGEAVLEAVLHHHIHRITLIHEMIIIAVAAALHHRRTLTIGVEGLRRGHREDMAIEEDDMMIDVEVVEAVVFTAAVATIGVDLLLHRVIAAVPLPMARLDR